LRRWASLLVLLGLVAPARAADELRERLTEREDENQLAEPWSVVVMGRPLMVSGQYEISLEPFRHLDLGDPTGEDDRALLEQELETELFYSLGPPLSFFAQLRLRMERDLDPGIEDRVSDLYVERGEMWVFSEDIAGSPVDVELGRLDFEDGRLWWWDEDLDAARISYENDPLEVAVALARELAPSRSDHSYVEPDNERVLRLIAELSWDWSADHSLELFALDQDDRSPTGRPGSFVRDEREDDSDARLTWMGVRGMGAWTSAARGTLGYWIDTGLVRGKEDLVEFVGISRRTSGVDSVTRRHVRGWAVDAGATWILPWAREPRITIGYALGSGDPDPDSGADRSFRQTGLHGNESGFGGVQRFRHYGELLDPELSNLAVVTLGGGLSLFTSSSLDLVYHYYRQAEPATFLRNARLDPELTGRDRDLGHELDLLLALEEGERFEIELIGSVFRAGRAFGQDRGEWAYGGFASLRIAF
jgi:hypothetical protein